MMASNEAIIMSALAAVYVHQRPHLATIPGIIYCLLRRRLCRARKRPFWDQVLNVATMSLIAEQGPSNPTRQHDQGTET